jgi:hypothetical protein
MRLGSTLFICAGLGMALVGCAPDASVNNGVEDVVSAFGVLVDSSAVSAATVSNAPDEATAQPRSEHTVVSGSLSARGEYQLFDLGAGQVGDEWTIQPDSPAAATFLVVLFDDQHELLRRELVSPRHPLQHILRADTPSVIVGVTPAAGGVSGSFGLAVDARAGAVVPAAQPQVVWVNFGGAMNVRVNQRAGIDIGAVDAAAVDARYAGATSALKAAILANMREDYADYNVTIVTSDDGPPPAGTYATLQFGGNDSRLLGLADSVDQYNADPAQTAIVYLESFADYRTMNLTVEEMGQMIGNTGSHELGHLLGLFHTQKPVDLMDTTGTAWDLAGAQYFTRGELEPSVFPTGYENNPARLAETVGSGPQSKKEVVAKVLSPAIMRRKLALRALVREELGGRCGNCLQPD